jgi:hypothetical protein
MASAELGFGLEQQVIGDNIVVTVHSHQRNLIVNL